MAGEVNGFKFSQYDVGGNGATANDGKLTGDEVQKARSAGWNVFDGMDENNIPDRTEEVMANFNSIFIKLNPAPGFNQNIDKSNDNAFDITWSVDKSNDKSFIPIDSKLGKQIGRTTKEYRPDIDKYKPVYGEPDALGRREIIGYIKPNMWDIFK